jgi:hypothetical protein
MRIKTHNNIDYHSRKIVILQVHVFPFASFSNETSLFGTKWVTKSLAVAGFLWYTDTILKKAAIS